MMKKEVDLAYQLLVSIMYVVNNWNNYETRYT